MKQFRIFCGSLLWLALLHFGLMSLIVVVSLLESFDFAWLLLVIGALTPGIYFLVGLRLPEQLRGTPLLMASLLWSTGIFLIVGISDYLDITVMWTFNFLHRLCAMVYLNFVFNTYHSAHSDVLQSLAISSTHLFMMCCFCLGLCVRNNRV